MTEIVREADDDGDWQAAGCSSSAQWLAQVSRSDHRTAARITRTSAALRSLPALDHALSTGALTLDQVAAAAEFATPGTDAELARIAVGMPPSAIALAARTIVPPTVRDDEELYERRALSMTWTHGRRELAFSGRLPLEQGAAFEQAIWSIAKAQRAADKTDRHDPRLAAVRRGRPRHARHAQQHRRRRQTQLHHPDRAHQRRRTAAPRRRRATEHRNSRATRLRRPPPRHQAERARPRALTRRTLRLLRAAARAAQALVALPVPRLHRRPRARGASPDPGRARRQDRARQPHPALPAAPQAAPRSPHPNHRQRRAARHSRTQAGARSPPTSPTRRRPEPNLFPPPFRTPARQAAPRRMRRRRRDGTSCRRPCIAPWAR